MSLVWSDLLKMTTFRVDHFENSPNDGRFGEKHIQMQTKFAQTFCVTNLSDFAKLHKQETCLKWSSGEYWRLLSPSTLENNMNKEQM